MRSLGSGHARGSAGRYIRAVDDPRYKDQAGDHARGHTFLMQAVISNNEELVAALAVSNPAVTREGAQRMVKVADANNDQTIDFDEFERIILRSAVYVRDR